MELAMLREIISATFGTFASPVDTLIVAVTHTIEQLFQLGALQGFLVN
jgi:hypothetical protein